MSDTVVIPGNDDDQGDAAFAAGFAAAVSAQAEQTATQASDQAETAVVVAQAADQQAAAATETAWDARIAVDDLRAEMGAAVSALSDQVGALLAAATAATEQPPADEAPAPGKNDDDQGDAEQPKQEEEKPKEKEKPAPKKYGNSRWFGHK